MTYPVRHFAIVLGLFLFFAAGSPAEAQKTRSKKARKEIGKKGPDGLVKGHVPDGNADRKMLLDRQQAFAQAKANGGVYSGPRYSLAPNKYDSGKGGFASGSYKNKIKEKKRKSKKIIDQDNPNGKLYKSGLKKRKRTFLFF